MDMKLGIQHTRSLYRAGSLKTVASEMAKCKLILVGVHDVIWDKSARKPADNWMHFYGNWNDNPYLGTGFFVQK